MAYRDGCTASLCKEGEAAIFSVTNERGHTQTIVLAYDIFDKLIRHHLGWCD